MSAQLLNFLAEARHHARLYELALRSAHQLACHEEPLLGLLLLPHIEPACRNSRELDELQDIMGKGDPVPETPQPATSPMTRVQKDQAAFEEYMRGLGFVTGGPMTARESAFFAGVAYARGGGVDPHPEPVARWVEPTTPEL